MKIIEDCHAEEILTEKQRAGQYDRVTSAVTSQGNIKCDVFINCTGMVWENISIPFEFLVGTRTWLSVITKCSNTYSSMR